MQVATQSDIARYNEAYPGYERGNIFTIYSIQIQLFKGEVVLFVVRLLGQLSISMGRFLNLNTVKE